MPLFYRIKNTICLNLKKAYSWNKHLLDAIHSLVNLGTGTLVCVLALDKNVQSIFKMLPVWLPTICLFLKIYVFEFEIGDPWSGKFQIGLELGLIFKSFKFL